MIVFLQGATHAGKSSLARMLAKATGAGVLSMDLLKMGLIRSKAAGLAGLTPEDDADIEKQLWPIVREMAFTADENGQHLVIEGVYLPFDETAALVRQLGPSRAALLAVVFTEAYLRKHYEIICRHADNVEARVHQEMPTLESLLREHAEVRRKAIACGWTLIEIDSPQAWTSKIERLEGVAPEILKALSV